MAKTLKYIQNAYILSEMCRVSFYAPYKQPIPNASEAHLNTEAQPQQGSWQGLLPVRQQIPNPHEPMYG